MAFTIPPKRNVITSVIKYSFIKEFFPIKTRVHTGNTIKSDKNEYNPKQLKIKIIPAEIMSETADANIIFFIFCFIGYLKVNNVKKKIEVFIRKFLNRKTSR